MTDASRPDPLPDWPLTERPGFLVRRLHQIHVALFNEACAQFDVTPVQYSLLSALAQRGPADQTTLAGDVALDRTTTTGALRRLQARGLVERATAAADRRSRECRLTVAGTDLLGRMESAARTAHHETLMGLGASDQAALVGLLVRLVAAHGSSGTGAEPKTLHPFPSYPGEGERVASINEVERSS